MSRPTVDQASKQNFVVNIQDSENWLFDDVSEIINSSNKKANFEISLPKPGPRPNEPQRRQASNEMYMLLSAFIPLKFSDSIRSKQEVGM